MEKYNGWTNHATWCVHLWLTSNDEETYRLTLGIVNPGDKDEEIWEKARRLEEYVRGRFDVACAELGPSLESDLLSHSIDDVNWQEIVKALTE